MQAMGSCYRNSFEYLIKKNLATLITQYMLHAELRPSMSLVQSVLHCFVNKSLWFFVFLYLVLLSSWASLLLWKVPNSKDEFLVTRVLLIQVLLEKHFCLESEISLKHGCEGRIGLH